MTAERQNGQSERQELSSKIEKEIRGFVLHPALTKLMTSFGYVPPDDNPPLERLIEHQVAFAKEHWDWRGGKARIEAKQAELTEEQKAAAMEAARDLGMIAPTTPRKKRYDAIVILGVKGRHSLWRTEYARACGAEAPVVVSLGSESPFDRKNLLQYEDYVPNLEKKRTEFDLMTAATEKVFQVKKHDAIDIEEGKPSDKDEQPDESEQGEEDISRMVKYSGENPHPQYRIRVYENDQPTQKPSVYALSAPSTEPLIRDANTEDTLDFFAHELPEAKDVLIVTGSIFAPYQHFDARRKLTLPFGVEVETIGHDTTITDDPLRKTRSVHTPQNYLQEINSALRAANKLYRSLQTSRDTSFESR